MVCEDIGEGWQSAEGGARSVKDGPTERMMRVERKIIRKRDYLTMARNDSLNLSLPA